MPDLTQTMLLIWVYLFSKDLSKEIYRWSMGELRRTLIHQRCQKWASQGLFRGTFGRPWRPIGIILKYFGKYISKCSSLVEKMPPLLCNRILFSPSNKQIDFNLTFGTHCKRILCPKNCGSKNVWLKQFFVWFKRFQVKKIWSLYNFGQKWKPKKNV